ncbi:SEC14-like protein 2 isoform X2 [Parasteatoda tepidariorum]|uniref:SEC14-like protein 2 isoform X2 n=1 Tax=Parasteatoda tepidariorum TaxID=114398 RepID=UPI001C71C858|nr:SEC14-like protein 2 isoform X1 [Parasteatoda tepidariorum]
MLRRSKMIEIEDVTEDERKAIEEFKHKMESEITPFLRQDKSLWYRFLKARDFDLKKAEIMLRKHMSDVKKFQIDEVSISYDPPEGIYDYIDFKCFGFDKDGCPAHYNCMGGTDLKGILSAYTILQIYHCVNRYLQESLKMLTEQSKKLGKVLTQFVFIFDMKGFSLYQASNKEALEAMYEGFKLFQDNYPERIKAIYVLNASLYFNIAFNIIKAILSRAVMNKIFIFGEEGYKEALLEQFDADVLPAFLGGNRTDPDGNPNCNTFIIHDGKVPTEMYRKNRKSKKALANLDGVKKLSLSRSSYSEILINILEEDSQIEWRFEIEARDIGFGLFYRDNSTVETVLEELIPLEKVDTVLAPETGLYQCRKIGTYVILFDNSYSWIRPKELYYTIRILKPNKERYDNL